MSYIAQLLDQRRQPDLLGGLMMGAGQLAGGLGQFQAQEQERKRLEEERKRKAAQERYQGLQEAGKGLMLAGQGQEAAKLIPGVRGAFNEAYGQSLPIPSIVGEPVMARGQEMVGGKMVPTPYTYDTGKRDFDNPRTTAGIRAGLMLGAPKPEENDLMAVSPYEDLIDKRTMKVVRAGREKPVTADKPRYDVDPVSGEVKPVVPGVRFGVKPDQSYSKAVTDWQQDRLMWVKDYVHLRTSANKKQTRDALGNVTTYQVPPTREEIDAWTKEAEAMYDSRRPMPPPPSGVGRQDPFGNPNTPSRGGIRPRVVVGGGTARWAPIVEKASAKYGVPQEIAMSVMRQESGGDPNATSPVGAKGLMQLMDGTARNLGVTNSYDPNQNIEAGVKHLRGLYDKLGSWTDAIAAYNAGADDTPANPKTGKRIGPFARSQDDPRYRVWENPNNTGYAETRNYVKRIKQDLKNQGIEISAAEAKRMAAFYERHGVKPGVSNA